MILPGFINRLLGKSSARALDAAGAGRRWADDRRLTSAGAVHADAATVSARAAHFALNTPMGRRIVESLVGNLVGDGIKSRSQHPDKTIAATLNANFALWIDRADAEGRGDFFSLQQAATNDLVVFGEYLFVILPALEDGAPQLRRCHPEQLARDTTRLTGDGGAIVQGVEFDRMGRIVAYHVRRHAPGDPLSAMALMPVRLPASDVLHGFRPIYPGQVRGLSWLAPVLLTANDHDRLVDAMIERAKVAALHAGFVRDAQGTGAYTGDQSGSELTASLEPGALITLPPGKDIEFPDVPDQNGALELIKDAMRRIAAGVGLTYEMLTGDYSQVNYSSARAGMLEFRRFASGVQFHQLVFPFCRPVWRRFVAWQAFTGEIDRVIYAASPLPFESAKWLPPAWAGVDPQKDAKADEIAVRNKFKSRAEVIAERGYDIEDVDREIEADNAKPANLPVSDAPAPAETTEETANA